ncbi:MAG: efflux RND transporter periplasmic adaptor subunit [Phycisphaerae bacterium]|nr:efflux RND transporter periplasmic adaptor subunit [Phycisphaerae bacterium]
MVEVVEAETRDLTRDLRITGEVVATRSVVVAATKEGPVTYCPWREGDRVRTGEKLIEIERDVHQAEARAARAALAVARARLADLRAGARPEEIARAEAVVQKWQATLYEARQAHDRQTQLVEQEFTSRQSVDQASERVGVATAELAAAAQTLRLLKAGPTATEVAVPEAVVEEAAARVALAEAHLAECVIAAPFDAVVTAVHVRAGDLAVPRTPLVEMVAPDSLVVRFSVPERFSAGLRQGMKLEAVLDAFPGQTVTGTIVRVYPLLHAEMRTRTAEATLNTENPLMPYQFARLTLHLDTVRDAVTVPADAILETPEGGRILFVVVEDKAIRRKVETGIEQDRVVQVTRGLSPGENVVVTGNEMLKNGVPVRIGGGKRSPEL